MTKDILEDMMGDFTWDFGQKFFIEASVGNFVWSDPDYNGDGSMERYSGTIQDWFDGGYGRDKGTHRIGSYCGNFTFSKEKKEG
jgi:hypothetical protein